MRVVAACLLAGCWTSRVTPPAAPEAASSGVIVDGAPTPWSPRTIERSRRDLLAHSVWEGTYVCNQGLSSVVLSIDIDRTGRATARYDFGPVPSNPTVPEGAYLLTGTAERQGRGFTAELVDSEWIVRPPGYFMVPLAIETDGTSMTGTIRHPSCHSFQAERVR